MDPQHYRKILQVLILWSLDVDRETVLGLLVNVLRERQSFNEADGLSNLPDIWCKDRWCEQVLGANISVPGRLLNSGKLIVEDLSMVKTRSVGVRDSQVVAGAGDYILLALEASI